MATDPETLPPEFSGAESESAVDTAESARPARVVRYGAMGYVGEFSAKPNLAFNYDSRVVVQTERGIELGEPVGVSSTGCSCGRTVPRAALQTYVRNSGTEFCHPKAGRVLRIANDQDVREHQHLNAHVRDDIDHCADVAHRLGLDLKIVTAEHLLGGERIVFYFSSSTRVDFRQLVKELAQRYRTRIEMRQVGARDEARLVADYEVCGRECCCKNFLKKLRPVNMKMAKLQKSTLDPSKVSGRCGRLRCCLRYENNGYEELAGRLPRVGNRVLTEFGPGTVVDRQILTQLLSVDLDDGRNFAIPLEEILETNLPPLPPKPAGPAAGAPPGVERQRRGGDRDRPRREVTAGRTGVPLPVVDSPSKFVPEEPPAPESEAAPPPVVARDAEAPPERERPPESAAAHPRATGRRRRRGRRHRRRGGPPATGCGETTPSP